MIIRVPASSVVSGSLRTKVLEEIWGNSTKYERSVAAEEIFNDYIRSIEPKTFASPPVDRSQIIHHSMSLHFDKGAAAHVIISRPKDSEEQLGPCCLFASVRLTTAIQAGKKGSRH